MPYTHRKVKNKQCVYKKSTGKKVGCTTGPVKKYLAALHINANKGESVSTFKEYFFNTIQGSQIVADEQHRAAEAMYADAQDETTPSQTLTDEVDKEQLIRDVINDLEDLKISHDWSQPLGDDLIKAMADTLRDAGIEPTDFDAAISAAPDKQEQYLIYGPSSWKGGQGALKDLKAIAAGNEPQEVKEDEANPASDLPAGSTTAGDPLSESTYKVGTVIFNNPFGTGRRYYQGTDKIEAASEDDALNKFVRLLARREQIPTNPRILYRDAQRNGARVIKLASSEPPVSDKPPQEYWWNK